MHTHNVRQSKSLNMYVCMFLKCVSVFVCVHARMGNSQSELQLAWAANQTGEHFQKEMN